MQKYEVIFSGEIAPGAQLQDVRAELGRLFNADAAVLERFFSGRPVVVKRDLDQVSAQKYQLAFNRAGAIVEVRPMVAAAEAAVFPAVPESADAEPVTGNSPEPRDEFMAAFAHVQAPDYGLAAPGADLMQLKPEVPELTLDLSAMSLAPAGSDLEQLPGAEPVAAPDISHLKLAD